MAWRQGPCAVTGDQEVRLYREPADRRNRTHWAFNEHGNVRPLDKSKRMIVLSVVVALAAVAVVVVENLG